MAIGFVKQARPARVALRNDQGERVGYIASIHGRQVIQNTEGSTVAIVLRWKQPLVPRTGACGGSFVPPGEYSEPR